MKILLLTTLVPAGPPSGGTLATVELSRRLETFGDVERWAVWTYDARAPEDRQWYGAQPITLARLRRHGIATAVLLRRPLGVARFFRRELAHRLGRCGAVDLFFADHIAVWQYARLVRATRRVLYSHNVESEIYQRAALLEPSLPKRLVWRYEARAMERYEAHALREPDRVICPGIRDQETLADRYRVDAEAWYPPVAGLGPVRNRLGSGRVVGAVASFTWQANRWGIDWFVERVWPAVRTAVPTARLVLVGRGSDRLPYVGTDAIEGRGIVSDLAAFYESVDLVVAPVHSGAGIKVKVMDGAGRGLPVVTTSIGVEGLGADLPASIAIADSEEEFAHSVVSGLRQKHHLPLEEGVAWYEALVRRGSSAVERAVMGTQASVWRTGGSDRSA